MNTLKKLVWLLPAALVLLVGSPAHAAGDEGHGPDWAVLGSAIFNFVVYVGAVVFLARKGVAEFFANRRRQLTATMDAAAARQAEARSRVETLSALVNGFETERATLVAEYRAVGEREAAKLSESTREAVAKIGEDAVVTAEVETRRALLDVEQRLVSRALELARAELTSSLGSAGQQALLDQSISSLSASAA